MISQPGCYPVTLSALEPPDLPWIPFNCAALGQPARPELYSPSRRRWLSVSPNPDLVPPCAAQFCDVIEYFPIAAGRSWIAYEQARCDTGGEHCGTYHVFQNLRTGELRQDPGGGAAVVDLNAPDLTRHVCRPLRVPTTLPAYNTRPIAGLLSFYGSFAVAIGGDVRGNSAYLERCGRRTHRLLSSAAGPDLGALVTPAVNMRELVWIAQPRAWLSALTLPGLRPFTIRLPKGLVGRYCAADDLRECVAQIGLTRRRLYVLRAAASSPAQLWAARAPSP